MSKYKVTREFMDALIKWRNDYVINYENEISFFDGNAMKRLPDEVTAWWLDDLVSFEENDQRLIAIIGWLHNSDIFEVEKPHKFIVRSVEENDVGEPLYLELKKERGLIVPNYGKENGITSFTTRMDAELWRTNGYEVVEVDGDGNEV